MAHALLVEAGLATPYGSDWCLQWNVVRWYVDDGTSIRAATSGDLDEAQPAPRTLLGLLSDLRVVLLVGKAAQNRWRRAGLNDTGLMTVDCLHTSPKVMNIQPGARERVLASFTEGAWLVDIA